MAVYPQAALLTLIVAFASKHGRRPSEVYSDYLEHPDDYSLLFAWENFVSEQEEKAIAEARG